MVTYRLAEEKDYPTINSFYNRIYSSSRTIEQFIWEFHDCPFGRSIYVIAEDGDKIVGTNCVIPIELVCADKSILRTGKSEDTLVDPDYRGQGIFFKMYEFLFEKCREANIKVIWGFTSAKKPFKKLGFEIPFDHKQSLAVNRLAGSYRYLSSLNSKNKSIDKIKIAGLCFLAKVKTLGKLKKHELAYRVQENSHVVQQVDDLISDNLSKAKGTFAIHQTSTFQEWRIYNNPNFYKVHTYSFYDKDENLVGLILFNSHASQIAFVCQSTFHSSLSKAEKVKMLQHATRLLFDSGIVIVRNWHFSTNEINREEAAIFKDASYTFLDRGIGFVWKELDKVEVIPEDFYLSRIATQGIL